MSVCCCCCCFVYLLFWCSFGSINNRCLNERSRKIYSISSNERTMKNVAAAHMKQDTVKQLKWIYIYMCVCAAFYSKAKITRPDFQHRAHISLAYTYRAPHARSRSIARERTSCARDMMWMWKVLPPYTRYRVRM